MAVLHQTGSGALSRAGAARAHGDRPGLRDDRRGQSPRGRRARGPAGDLRQARRCRQARRRGPTHRGRSRWTVEPPRAEGTPEAPSSTAATPRPARAEPERPAPRRGGRRIRRRRGPARRARVRVCGRGGDPAGGGPAGPRAPHHGRPAGARHPPTGTASLRLPRPLPGQGRATSAWCTAWAGWAICSWPPASSPRSSSTQALAEPEGHERKARLHPASGSSIINEDQLIDFLSKQYGIPSITLSQLDVDAEVVKLVPAQIARKYEVLPIKRTGNQLTLAMADPTNVFAVDDVGFMTGLQVVPVVASQGAIRQAIDRLYEAQTGGLAEVLSEMDAAGGRRRGRRGRGGAVGQGRHLRAEGVGGRGPGGPARQHDPGGRHPPRAPPTSTSSPTRRSSGCASASTACCTRS